MTGVGFQAIDFIAATTNGGMSWDTLLNEEIDPRYGLRNIVFWDEKHGLAAGALGKILRTVDGGKTWTRELVGIDTIFEPHVTAIAYMSASRAVAVTYFGYIELSEVPVASTVMPAARQAEAEAAYDRERLLIHIRNGGNGCSEILGLWDLLGRRVESMPSASGLCQWEAADIDAAKSVF